MEEEDKKTLMAHEKKITILTKDIEMVKNSQNTIKKSQETMTEIASENASNLKVLVEQVSTVVGEIGKMAKRQFLVQEKNEKVQDDNRSEIKELGEINHRQDMDNLKSKLGFLEKNKDKIVGTVIGLVISTIYMKLMGLF